MLFDNLKVYYAFFYTIGNSRIPGVPGIRTIRAHCSVPGMERVGTVWCPYVL